MNATQKNDMAEILIQQCTDFFTITIDDLEEALCEIGWPPEAIFRQIDAIQLEISDAKKLSD
tara:strand:+ start:50 stop:235 length:186 start_codon:yes stop_codon:yes gene_type:complete